MTATTAKLRSQLARVMAAALVRHIDWTLSYLDLTLLKVSLGLDEAVVLGCDEE